MMMTAMMMTAMMMTLLAMTPQLMRFWLKLWQRARESARGAWLRGGWRHAEE
jgi:hypothetical protein